MWADLTDRETEEGRQNLERMRTLGSRRVPTIAVFRQDPENAAVLVSGKISAGVFAALIDDAATWKEGR